MKYYKYTQICKGSPQRKNTAQMTPVPCTPFGHFFPFPRPNSKRKPQKKCPDESLRLIYQTICLFSTSTILSYIIIAGKHSATMHEEHACKLHKAPTHHPRGLHIRWQRVLDTTGRAIGNCSQYRPQQSTSLHPGWDLLFCRIHNRLRRVRRAEGDPVLRELNLDQRSLLPGGGLEPGDVQVQLSRGI